MLRFTDFEQAFTVGNSFRDLRRDPLRILARATTTPRGVCLRWLCFRFHGLLYHMTGRLQRSQ